LRKILKKIYHLALKMILPLFGMDFEWYRVFYTRWPRAIPVVEKISRSVRTKEKAMRMFAGYPVEDLAGDGAPALDIGANVGDVTSCLLSLGFRVHAYEPDSRCTAFMRKRFGGEIGKSVNIHHAAVSNHDGEITLNYGDITPESNSILMAKPGATSSGGEMVRVENISGILKKLEYVPLVKMDVEGAEYDILEEMLRPENIGRFGICLVESHAGKIPGLEEKHKAIEKHIKENNLEEKIFLDWR
jgi:FkbM family methyltransferase